MLEKSSTDKSVKKFHNELGEIFTMTIIRANSDHPHFALLASELEAELRIRDGENHELYAQLNKVDILDHVLIAYKKDAPAGCGALRIYAPGTMEMKRVYVKPEFRKMGIAAELVAQLETWCIELGNFSCILETGKNQPEAISLYKKLSYQEIPKFGIYQHSENSVCFRKELG
jgi:GNAT superfamily N-acetyltransferase